MKAHIDIESFSKTDLKKAGMYRYAEDTSTEITCLFYCFGDGPVHGWVPYGSIPEEAYPLAGRVDGEFHVQARCPHDLCQWVEDGKPLAAHNAAFERVMLNGLPGEKIGFPKTPAEQWFCTAAMAAANGLPRDLKRAAQEAGTHPKDDTGRGVMLQFAKPRKPTKNLPESRFTPWNSPEKFRNLLHYCADDVRAERGLDDFLPDLPKRERQAYLLDQKINDRGIRVDVDAVRDVRALIAQYKANLEEACRNLTGGINPTQTAQLADWIREQGYDIENLQAPTVAEALVDESVPRQVSKVLKIRYLHAMKAVSKYDAIDRAVCKDGRLRGMFLFFGAATGRWAGRIVQLQNLHRGYLKDPDTAIEVYRERDLEWIRFLFEVEPMKVFASTVRGMLIPDPGRKFWAADYNAIEGRVLAWLAGQEDKLVVYRDHGKVYEYTGSRIYGLPLDVESLKRMKKRHPQARFIGKVAELACGYQGGKGAFAKMAHNFGVEVTEEEAVVHVQRWRDENPRIVRFWYALEESARAAVSRPGEVFGVSGNKIMFRRTGRFLHMRLPSGRKLTYLDPEVRDGKLTYMGIDTYTRQWQRIDSFGGLLSQNATQAVAYDLLINGMLKLDAAGYDLVGSVHDEALGEVPEDQQDMDRICSIMCDLPKWADGLPLTADGFFADRYRKDD